MPTFRRRLGTFGETVAAQFLMNKGYDVRDRQWRRRSGEIDIIAQDGETLVFCEVRTRRGTEELGTPEESVTQAKQLRLIGLAQLYLQEQDMAEDTPWRIDVIAIEIDRYGRVARVNHLPGAIEAIESI